MEMSLGPVPLAVIAALNLAIGLYVYRCAPQAGQNRAFAFMAVAISLWTIALATAYHARIGHTWAIRLAFASSSLIPLGVLAFVDHLPVRSPSHIRVKKWVFTPVGIVFCLLSFSPVVVVYVTPHPSFDRFLTTYGPLYPVFAAYVIACFAYSFHVLAAKYRVSTGLLRLQIRYLVFAITISSGLATASNLLVPLLLKTSALSK